MITTMTQQQVDEISGGTRAGTKVSALAQELGDLKSGEYARYDVPEGQSAKRPTIRANIKAACRRNGMEALFIRTRDGSVVFQVLSKEAYKAVAPSVPGRKPGNKGGSSPSHPAK